MHNKNKNHLLYDTSILLKHRDNSNKNKESNNLNVLPKLIIIKKQSSNSDLIGNSSI